MSTTVAAFECDLRDSSTASSKSASALSLEVSSLAFFEEFLTHIDDEGRSALERIEDRRLQEYVKKGNLRKSRRMLKNKHGTTSSRTIYSFSTTSTNPPNEGDAAAGINRQGRRSQQPGRLGRLSHLLRRARSPSEGDADAAGTNCKGRRSQQLRVRSTAA